MIDHKTKYYELFVSFFNINLLAPIDCTTASLTARFDDKQRKSAFGTRSTQLSANEACTVTHQVSSNMAVVNA